MPPLWLRLLPLLGAMSGAAAQDGAFNATAFMRLPYAKKMLAESWCLFTTPSACHATTLGAADAARARPIAMLTGAHAPTAAGTPPADAGAAEGAGGVAGGGLLTRRERKLIAEPSAGASSSCAATFCVRHLELEPRSTQVRPVC